MTDLATQLLHREMLLETEPVEARADGASEKRIAIAMSSEAPVLRYDWWTGERYYEVLDHSPGSVDLTYARDGVPFLLDHSTRVQIGLVDDITLGKDRKLRGFASMGNHPDAEWVEKDIRGGIRKKVSIGYDPGQNYTVISQKDDKIPTRRYTGWRLYETSSVAVPADYDVGIARSAFEGRAALGKSPSSSPNGREATMDTTVQGNTAPAPASAVGVTRDYDAERKARFAELGNIAKLSGREDLLSDALVRDLAPSAFAELCIAENVKRAQAPVPAGRIELTQKEQKQYSLARAVAAMAGLQTGEHGARELAGFEFEVSQEIAKRLKQEPTGMWIPMTLSADREAAAHLRAAVTGGVVGTASLGGVGVPTNVQDLVEILRNETLVMQMGAKSLSGLTGDVKFPRQITANTWTWEGENPSTAKSLTAATFDSFTMAPKTGYGATAYSKQFLLQSSFSVEQMVREDQARIAAIGIDAAAIAGTGTSQPTGILTTSGIGTVTIGSNGGPLTWAKIVEFETTQATNNAARGRLAFLTTPGVRGSLKGILKNTVNGSQYIWGESNQLNGYDGFATNQVPSNLTKGTSTTVCHGVIFGNWQELIIGTWGDALDILVNPYIYQTQGMIQVVANAMVDVGIRHPKSFTVGVDVTL